MPRPYKGAVLGPGMPGPEVEVGGKARIGRLSRRRYNVNIHAPKTQREGCGSKSTGDR
jgi:hypothetical protein